ncbi:MAG: hypothetical protein DI551_11830 [Micavibrio aeruginosavorus]|uniref:Uncharacterized protein n=1 Tax=Micavibrio aeruginosavorus TaxID=349221 RepID=A0A2W5MS64_9BACT|nr:MAG: hypothetical protein DI551_11830 [Micavibrio aeruginosavorus]
MADQDDFQKALNDFTSIDQNQGAASVQETATLLLGMAKGNEERLRKLCGALNKINPDLIIEDLSVYQSLESAFSKAMDEDPLLASIMKRMNFDTILARLDTDFWEAHQVFHHHAQLEELLTDDNAPLTSEFIAAGNSSLNARLAWFIPHTPCADDDSKLTVVMTDFQKTTQEIKQELNSGNVEPRTAKHYAQLLEHAAVFERAVAKEISPQDAADIIRSHGDKTYYQTLTP